MDNAAYFQPFHGGSAVPGGGLHLPAAPAAPAVGALGVPQESFLMHVGTAPSAQAGPPTQVHQAAQALPGVPSAPPSFSWDALGLGPAPAAAALDGGARGPASVHAPHAMPSGLSGQPMNLFQQIPGSYAGAATSVADPRASGAYYFGSSPLPHSGTAYSTSVSSSSSSYLPVGAPLGPKRAEPAFPHSMGSVPGAPASDKSTGYPAYRPHVGPSAPPAAPSATSSGSTVFIRGPDGQLIAVPVTDGMILLSSPQGGSYYLPVSTSGAGAEYPGRTDGYHAEANSSQGRVTPGMTHDRWSPASSQGLGAQPFSRPAQGPQHSSTRSESGRDGHSFKPMQPSTSMSSEASPFPIDDGSSELNDQLTSPSPSTVHLRRDAIIDALRSYLRDGSGVVFDEVSSTLANAKKHIIRRSRAARFSPSVSKPGKEGWVRLSSLGQAGVISSLKSILDKLGGEVVDRCVASGQVGSGPLGATPINPPVVRGSSPGSTNSRQTPSPSRSGAPTPSNDPVLENGGPRVRAKLKLSHLLKALDWLEVRDVGTDAWVRPRPSNSHHHYPQSHDNFEVENDADSIDSSRSDRRQSMNSVDNGMYRVSFILSQLVFYVSHAILFSSNLRASKAPAVALVFMEGGKGFMALEGAAGRIVLMLEFAERHHRPILGHQLLRPTHWRFLDKAYPWFLLFLATAATWAVGQASVTRVMTIVTI